MMLRYFVWNHLSRVLSPEYILYEINLACASINQEAMAENKSSSKSTEVFLRKWAQKIVLYHTTRALNSVKVIHTGIKLKSSVLSIISVTLKFCKQNLWSQNSSAGSVLGSLSCVMQLRWFDPPWSRPTVGFFPLEISTPLPTNFSKECITSVHAHISPHGLKRSLQSCPRWVNASNKSTPCIHHPKNGMGHHLQHLKKKKVHIRIQSDQNGESLRSSRNTEDNEANSTVFVMKSHRKGSFLKIFIRKWNWYSSDKQV